MKKMKMNLINSAEAKEVRGGIKVPGVPACGMKEYGKTCYYNYFPEGNPFEDILKDFRMEK